MIKGDTQKVIHPRPEQADIRTGKDDPNGSDGVPGDEQGQRDGHQTGGNPPTPFRHGQGDEDT